MIWIMSLFFFSNTVKYVAEKFAEIMAKRLIREGDRNKSLQ